MHWRTNYWNKGWLFDMKALLLNSRASCCSSQSSVCASGFIWQAVWYEECASRAGSGCCWGLWGEGRLLSPPLWTRPLFCSPCSTCLALLSLTAGQAFLRCHSHPSQTDSLYNHSVLSITLWISAASCVQCVCVCTRANAGIFSKHRRRVETWPDTRRSFCWLFT